MLLLILLGLSLNACAGLQVKTHGADVMDFTSSVPTLKQDQTPEYCTSGETDPPADCECYEDGVFNENLGHDTLDCGNL